MTMRLGGLASGIDTESMIKQLMQAERLPMQRLLQDKITMEWQQDAYREVNLLMTNFRNSLQVSNGGLMSRATFYQKAVTSSNSSVVTAVGTSNAQNATATIQVHNLAESATWQSTDGAFEMDSKFLTQRMGAWTEGDGPDIEWDADGKAVMSFSVTKPGETKPTEVNITINKTDTVNNVISRMNRSQVGFSTFVDQRADGTGKTVVSMAQTGEGADIRLVEDANGTNNAASFFASLGFNTAGGGESVSLNDTGHQATAGKNASFTYNGYQMERASNDFTVSGVTYTLHGTSNDPVRVTTATDTEAVFNSIMEFVDQYNEMIDKINGLLREENYRDYRPLTEEQRADMSEREIELWEEKARSGLLRNDPILSSAMNQLRSSIFGTVQNVDGVFNSLAQIGLTTSSDYRDGGKIVFDTRHMTMPDGTRLTGEARLRHAIENNPEDVYQLFNATGGTDANGNKIAGERGILGRVNDQLRTVTNRVTERAGREGRTLQQFALGRDILRVEDRITNFERRLQQIEARYWKQFTAMEKAVQEMNSQASQLFSMMGMGHQ
ncbi:flagellar hook-associated protein 2 [Salipaludibacillus agaradhaerens]|uniref:Flagellar hook-associated protein 2 n=1 Tax=Salipaludibacillus agaradhaerens TaxID=76935 RepID=A0A9Q4FXV4_SALAG|nr:flagellar hook-associated protein 2 [Salipaludibacillus agaradhaerens]MCR6095073.1 flagellar hook-associated protein 2 [Salipaludibacillus agaradhaerens]MCR6115369.1 flagellar hook-associated protein 2 [Salipaludibacillus agaradhaerens]